MKPIEVLALREGRFVGVVVGGAEVLRQVLGVGADECARAVSGGVVPHREFVLVAKDHVGAGRPPQLVVGAGHDLTDDLTGNHPAHRGVQVRRKATLGLDRA